MIKRLADSALSIIIVLTLGMAAILLLQIWADAFTWQFIWKLSATYGIVVVALALVMTASRDAEGEKEMKKKKYLD